MSLRDLLTGTIVGAIVALLVRELTQYGLVLSNWRLPLPRGLEAVETGAVIGALSQIISQRRSAR